MINERRVINFEQDTAKVIQIHRWNLSLQLPNNPTQRKGDVTYAGSSELRLRAGQWSIRAPPRKNRTVSAHLRKRAKGIATGYPNMDFHPYHKKKSAKKLIRNICTTQPYETICYNVFCIKTAIKSEERVEVQMVRKTMIEGFLIFTRHW